MGVKKLPENAIQYAILTEFDGSVFHGWQRQRNAPSVQACLEDAWEALTGERIVLRGGSRTDAGVSALGHVSAFHTTSSIPEDRIARAWNTKLPDGVVVCAATRVHHDFHARYDTLGKLYRYTIKTGSTRSVLSRHTTAFVPGELDVDAMREAIPFLEGTHDFSAFMDQGSPTKRLERTLYDIKLTPGARRLEEPTQTDKLLHDVKRGRETDLVIKIMGDGFLYHMARIIVGTLVYIGEGKIAPQELLSVLKNKDRTLAGPTMPAAGLLLERVFFADELFGDDRWPYEDERREAKLATLKPSV